MIDVLLIYPKLGSMDSMVMDLPLSVIYAAAQSVKQGYKVRILDLRVVNEDWKKEVQAALDKGVLLAGVSVMTGMPLKHAREVSTFIKDNSPDTKTVWGGPHATVLPETINEPYLDYLIRGYGSNSLAALIKVLKSKKQDLSKIKGLSYKKNGKAVHNPRSCEHEMIHYTELPYHLVDMNSPSYVRTYSNQRMFPLFSSIGCPYRCSFCVHPAIYKVINGAKWKPYPDDEVVGHIEYVKKTHGASHIVIMDDTTFPDLKRMRRLFNMIVERDLDVTLEFRGARINEIDRMDDDFLDLMVRAGGRFMMVGAESGSDYVLKSFGKGITRKQILRCNRKLARYPQLVVYYNFIYGTPGETYEHLLETKDMALQLIKDNPNAYMGFGGDWKPIPGTKTLDIAVKECGYKTPESIDDWIKIDSSDVEKKICHPWYSRRHNNLIKLMQVTSFVIDDKIIKESAGNTQPLFRVLRTMSRIYRPMAMFRLKTNFHHFLVEYKAWQILAKILPRLQSWS